MQDRTGTDLDAMLAHAGWLRGLALQLCTDVHRAEDAAQTTFLAALQQPPRDPQRAKGFLARTLRNVLRMHVRTSRRRRQREQSVAPLADTRSADAAELVARSELYRQLLDEVAALPEPQHSLVLRHYLEGEDIAALALHSQLTPDAVRAHLRRARERLRAGLHRRGGEAWRGFGALLLGTRPLLAPAGSMTAATLAAGVSLMKWKIVIGPVVAAAAILWFVPFGSAPPAASPPTSPKALAPVTAISDGALPLAMPPLQRSEVQPAVPLPIHGQLTGLHPALPWTARLTLRASTEAAGTSTCEIAPTVAGDGSFAAELPAWTRDCDALRLQVTAADPWYQAVDQGFGPEAIAAGLLLLKVAPVAALVGNVVDADGVPVEGARILVFAADGAVPRSSLAAESSSDAQGRYRVHLAAEGECFVVAIPTATATAAGAAGMRRFLPAGISVPAAATPVRELQTIVLPAAAFVTGTVRWSNGGPVAEATVSLTPASTVALDRKLRLGWQPDALVVQQQTALTSPDGRFALPALAGTAGRAVVERVGPLLPGKFAATAVVAPQEVELQLEGRPVTLRVLADGLPAGRAGIEWQRTDFAGNYGTDERGELHLLVLDEKFEVRALSLDGAMASEWARFPLGPPELVELQLLPTAGDLVTVQVQSTPPLPLAAFSWQTSDGTSKSLDFTLRGEAGCFRMRVPGGSYHLRMLPIMGTVAEDPLPCGRDVTLPSAEPIALSPQFGGRLRLVVTDNQGAFVGGSCRLLDATAKATAPHFVHDERGGSGPAGQFRATAPGVSAEAIPAGRYESVLDLGIHGVLRRQIEIKACEVTEQRIRLP